MDIPKLKRIRPSSADALETWLARNATETERVMLVTQARPSSPDHVSREEVAEALAAHGWSAGPRYTLNAALLGHVIQRRAEARTARAGAR